MACPHFEIQMIYIRILLEAVAYANNVTFDGIASLLQYFTSARTVSISQFTKASCVSHEALSILSHCTLVKQNGKEKKKT